jgi:hypothetical protein
MKTKALTLIALAAVLTLSFTFANVNKTDKQELKQEFKTSHSEPAGGFAMDDKN